MEIRLPPDQEARLAAAAARAGRSMAELIQEAVALWEENERITAELRVSLDEAEASIAREEGLDLTRQALERLNDDLIERTRARLVTEGTPLP